jgi:hypothetical protein
MKKYTINVVRNGPSGRLTFTDGTVTVDTECWWDPEVVIDEGTYTGFATRMSNKSDGRPGPGGKAQKREGIWFGREKTPCNNRALYCGGIFIHKGKNAKWSDGCIVCNESEVLRIWDAIAPKEQGNVEINIRNAVPVHFRCSHGP